MKIKKAAPAFARPSEMVCSSDCHGWYKEGKIKPIHNNPIIEKQRKKIIFSPYHYQFFYSSSSF
jgi:hypothetical protein